MIVHFTPVIKSGFEPFFYASLAGLVVLAMYRRKYRLWFWGAFFFAGMLLWRIRYIGSHRYAVLLILPMIFFSVFLMMQSETAFPRLLPETKWRKRLPHLLGAALFLGCVGQVLHINPYGDFPIRCGQAVARDAAGNPNAVLLVYNKRMAQFGYYAGVESIRQPVNSTGEQMGMTAENYLPFYDAVYLILDEPAGRDSPVRRFGPVECRRIFSSYKNIRKKEQCTVWRCSASDSRPPENDGLEEKNIWTEQACELPEFLAASFGTPPGELTFFRRKNLKLPLGWGANFAHGGYAPDSGAEVEWLPGDKASEQAEIRMKSVSPILISTQESFPCGKRGLLQFSYRGVAGSEFQPGIYLYDEKDQYIGYRLFPGFTIPKEGTARYSQQLVFSPAEEKMKFRVCLSLLRGEVWYWDLQLRQ